MMLVNLNKRIQLQTMHQESTTCLNRVNHVNIEMFVSGFEEF